MGIWEGEIPRGSADLLLLLGEGTEREVSSFFPSCLLCSGVVSPFALEFLSSPGRTPAGGLRPGRLWILRVGKIRSGDSLAGCKLLKLFDLI